MKSLYYISLIALFLLSACEIRLKTDDDDLKTRIEVQRYDRLEGRYLTTGDFSALQQMNIDYPMETRTLIEDVLRLGEVNDPEINSRFLNFYQDTILQSIIADAELQYASMTDINKGLSLAFDRLDELIPGLPTPTVYSQIGALDQSIIVGDNTIGISLDKYLGCEYPLYFKYYSATQRRGMAREYIVPDCMCFYLLAQFPLRNHDAKTQELRDLHMGKVMWTVNRVVGKNFFQTPYVDRVDRYMRHHPRTAMRDLLLSQDSTLDD